jgi:hypothetical protein
MVNPGDLPDTLQSRKDAGLDDMKHLQHLNSYPRISHVCHKYVRTNSVVTCQKYHATKTGHESPSPPPPKYRPVILFDFSAMLFGKKLKD